MLNLPGKYLTDDFKILLIDLTEGGTDEVKKSFVQFYCDLEGGALLGTKGKNFPIIFLHYSPSGVVIFGFFSCLIGLRRFQ